MTGAGTGVGRKLPMSNCRAKGNGPQNKWENQSQNIGAGRLQVGLLGMTPSLFQRPQLNFHKEEKCICAPMHNELIPNIYQTMPL